MVRVVADVYAAITDADPALVARIAEVLELRAADPQQAAMRRAYLGDIRFPTGARVLEVGCGTGAVTRELAGWPGVAEVVGLDPSPPSWPAPAGTTRPPTWSSWRGTLGRSTSPTGPSTWWSSTPPCAMCPSPSDPLQACVDAWVSSSVHDPWLVRRLPGLLAAAGFSLVWMRSFGYVETGEARYVPTIVDRGAAALVGEGWIGGELAAALKAEARRRSAAGQFFGHIAYASLVATLPDQGAA
jgi:Methyltransferase domain